MNDQILYGVVAVPAIIGLVQVLKQIGVPSRFSPLSAVAVGVLFALGELYKDRFSWIQAVVVGVGLGLSAAGLYSGSQALLQKPSFPPQNPPQNEQTHQ
jgi:hypothetical protein